MNATMLRCRFLVLVLVALLPEILFLTGCMGCRAGFLAILEVPVKGDETRVDCHGVCQQRYSQVKGSAQCAHPRMPERPERIGHRGSRFPPGKKLGAP